MAHKAHSTQPRSKPIPAIMANHPVAPQVNKQEQPEKPSVSQLQRLSRIKRYRSKKESLIYLRQPRHADGQVFTDLMQASRHAHRPFAIPPTDLVKYHRLLKRAQCEDCESRLIFRRQDNAIVGYINLNNIMRDEGEVKSASLGYALGVDFIGLGYMHAAMNEIIQLAFQQLQLEQLIAWVHPDNLRSIALLNRNYFEKNKIGEPLIKNKGRLSGYQQWLLRRG